MVSRLKSSTLGVVVAMVIVMTALVVFIFTNWLNNGKAPANKDIYVHGVIISIITVAMFGMIGVFIAGKTSCEDKGRDN